MLGDILPIFGRQRYTSSRILRRKYTEGGRRVKKWTTHADVHYRAKDVEDADVCCFG